MTAEAKFGMFLIFIVSALGCNWLIDHLPAACPADAFIAVIPLNWRPPAVVLPTLAITICYLTIVQGGGSGTVSLNVEGSGPITMPAPIPASMVALLALLAASGTFAFTARAAFCATPAGLEVQRGLLMPRHQLTWPSLQDLVASCTQSGKPPSSIILHATVDGDEINLAPFEVLPAQDRLMTALQAHHRSLRLSGFGPTCTSRWRARIEDLAAFRPAPPDANVEPQEDVGDPP